MHSDGVYDFIGYKVLASLFIGLFGDQDNAMILVSCYLKIWIVSIVFQFMSGAGRSNTLP